MIALAHAALPATDDETLKKLLAVQQVMLSEKQVDIPTHHVLHAGMYARTITMPPGVVLMGALVKIPTIVTVVGSAKVFVGEWVDVRGYQVLPARAGRKQIFVSMSALIVTMTFPTSAQTVEEAEREFTDDAEMLLSRKQDLNTVVITGE